MSFDADSSSSQNNARANGLASVHVRRGRLRMAISSKCRVIVTSLVVVVVAVTASMWVNWPRIERWGVGIHQRSLTRSLAAWGVANAQVTNDASAIKAAEMVGYISSYYVPSPRYRGPLEIEAALETQRSESIDGIVASLERYTGLDYGTNVVRWTEWAEKRKGREPGGAANGSQPIRAETSRVQSNLSTGHDPAIDPPAEYVHCWFVVDNGSGGSGYVLVPGMTSRQLSDDEHLYPTIESVRESLRYFARRGKAIVTTAEWPFYIPTVWKSRSLTPEELDQIQRYQD